MSVRRLCTVCARGGSKGAPGKNVRLIAGRPLIAHSIGHALASGLFEAVAVSSDDEAILAAGLDAGATLAIRRPDEMATDTAGKLPAIRHAALEAERRLGARFEVFVDLDATSPLRAVSDVVGATALLETTGAASVITGAPSRRSPYFNLVEIDAEGRVGPSKRPPATVLRRQDAPPTYDMNASIYVWTRRGLIDEPAVFHPDTRLFVMPEERSLDIDGELDFDIVRHLMERAP